MPWKNRNGRPYYYQSVRDGGRVRSDYAGSGEAAERAARAAEAGRRRRAEASAIRRAVRSRLDEDERERVVSFLQVALLLGLALESAGFRRHKRGEWRRTRADGIPPEARACRSSPTPTPRPDVLEVLTRAGSGDEAAVGLLRDLLRCDLPGVIDVCGEEIRSREWSAFVGRMGVHRPRDDREARYEGGGPMAAGEIVPVGAELDALAAKAHRGDGAALATVRRALAGEPERLIRLGRGDLARGVESLAVARIGGEDQLLRDAVRAKMDSLRAELEGPRPSPIERLLAERAALCWLDCHGADLMAEVECRKTSDPKVRDHHDRRRERAHRRYVSALKSLAQVRKLALPAIQVNIGGQQVNVAGQ